VQTGDEPSSADEGADRIMDLVQGLRRRVRRIRYESVEPTLGEEPERRCPRPLRVSRPVRALVDPALARLPCSPALEFDPDRERLQMLVPCRVESPPGGSRSQVRALVRRTLSFRERVSGLEPLDELVGGEGPAGGLRRKNTSHEVLRVY